MQVIWEKGSATVAAVAEALRDKPELAYNTVLTTLRILEHKGYLRHTKPEAGRAFVYHPVIGREQASRKALRHLVNRFFGSSPELLVLNLLKDEDISERELKRIRKLISEGGK
jgi:predicted transcriptional regulator